jgi:hypothetical protein
MLVGMFIKVFIMILIIYLLGSFVEDIREG